MKLKIVNAPRQGRGRGLVLRYGRVTLGFGAATVVLDQDGAVCWLGFAGSLPRVRAFFPAAILVEDQVAIEDAVLDNPRPPLALYGTQFQTTVWRALLEIRSGRTATYQEIAQGVGRPKALRAVGTAIGANPVSVLVPCHRVINKSGAIDKYAWGPARKRRLLRHEGAL